MPFYGTSPNGDQKCIDFVLLKTHIGNQELPEKGSSFLVVRKVYIFAKYYSTYVLITRIYTFLLSTEVL